MCVYVQAASLSQVLAADAAGAPGAHVADQGTRNEMLWIGDSALNDVQRSKILTPPLGVSEPDVRPEDLATRTVADVTGACKHVFHMQQLFSCPGERPLAWVRTE